MQALMAKEPHIANNMTLKMKEYEKITDAEMQAIGRVGGSLLTILGVVATIFVMVSIVVALTVGGVVLFYFWAIVQSA